MAWIGFDKMAWLGFGLKPRLLYLQMNMWLNQKWKKKSLCYNTYQILSNSCEKYFQFKIQKTK